MVVLGVVPHVRPEFQKAWFGSNGGIPPILRCIGDETYTEAGIGALWPTSLCTRFRLDEPAMRSLM